MKKACSARGTRLFQLHAEIFLQAACDEICEVEHEETYSYAGYGVEQCHSLPLRADEEIILVDKS